MTQRIKQWWPLSDQDSFASFFTAGDILADFEMQQERSSLPHCLITASYLITHQYTYLMCE